jgi:hypothetical protein
VKLAGDIDYQDGFKGSKFPLQDQEQDEFENLPDHYTTPDSDATADEMYEKNRKLIRAMRIRAASGR